MTGSGDRVELHIDQSVRPESATDLIDAIHDDGRVPPVGDHAGSDARRVR